MKYEDLLDIIKTGEGYTIEFKESINTSLGKEICAFANSSGGKIIIGVDDHNRIKGYKLKNVEKSRIQDIARNMNPSFSVQVEQIRDLAIVYVPEGKDKPYTVKGHFYLRYGANSQQLNRDEIRNLFQKESKISFEKQVVEFDDKDFSNKSLSNFKKKAKLTISKKNIFKNLNLTTNDKINNAGVLFFSKEIKKYHPTATVNCFLYSDKEEVDIIDSKEFCQDFITNLEEAYKYLISKLNNAIILNGKLQHERKLEIPKEALREALINAMVHKDYLFPSNVQINISPLKVEIVNAGKLLFPKKEFGKLSAYRNPIIADLMQRLNEIEKAGSGIKRIKKYCKLEKIKVKFETDDIFRTIFYRPKQIRSKSETNPKQIRSKSKAERQKWIIKQLKQTNHIKTKQIELYFNINRDTAIEDLNQMIKEGQIIKKGGGNNVWYELK